MANADRPRGFWPHGKILRLSEYESGSACYPGDMVVLASDGQVDPSASAGTALLGCCISYASAAGQSVLVCDDPEQKYVVQADETQASSQAIVGCAADVVVTAGDSTFKTSRQELDSSDAAQSAGPLIILAKETRPDNAFGAQVDLIVKINEHQLKDAYNGV
jgi:hypothetical protein